jgi:hypothetical protein
MEDSSSGHWLSYGALLNLVKLSDLVFDLVDSVEGSEKVGLDVGADSSGFTFELEKIGHKVWVVGHKLEL